MGCADSGALVSKLQRIQDQVQESGALLEQMRLNESWDSAVEEILSLQTNLDEIPALQTWLNTLLERAEIEKISIVVDGILKKFPAAFCAKPEREAGSSLIFLQILKNNQERICEQQHQTMLKEFERLLSAEESNFEEWQVLQEEASEWLVKVQPDDTESSSSSAGSSAGGAVGAAIVVPVFAALALLRRRRNNNNNNNNKKQTSSRRSARRAAASARDDEERRRHRRSTSSRRGGRRSSRPASSRSSRRSSTQY